MGTFIINSDLSFNWMSSENDFSKIDSNFTSRIVLGGLEQPSDENFFLKNTNKEAWTKLTFLNRDWNFEVSDLLVEHPIHHLISDQQNYHLITKQR